MKSFLGSATLSRMRKDIMPRRYRLKANGKERLKRTSRAKQKQIEVLTVEDSPQLAAGIFNTGGKVGRLGRQFFVNVKCGLLPEAEHLVKLAKRHTFNWKWMTIAFIGRRMGV